MQAGRQPAVATGWGLHWQVSHATQHVYWHASPVPRFKSYRRAIAFKSAFVAPVGVDGPRPARISQNEGCRRSSTREPSMAKTIRIGIDTSKSVFQLHAVDETEKPVLRKQLRRSQMLEFFSKLEPTKIGLEACGASHYWARELTGLGHQVLLVPPQYAKKYVKRNKNDAADAEAICEAMSRPTMRFVPVKTAEQQAALMLVGTREALIRRRTQLSNSIRGYAAEFGLVAAKGLDKIEPLLARIAADTALPSLAKEMFATLGKEYERLKADIGQIDAKQMAWHKGNECSRRLVKVPAIGPITASVMVMKVPDPGAFGSGRDFSAWIGLTPKDHSTAGKKRLGVITRRLLAQPSGRRSDIGHQAGAGWKAPTIALACGVARAQAGKACSSRAGQQKCPRRLEAHDQRRALRSLPIPRRRGRGARCPRGARSCAMYGLRVAHLARAPRQVARPAQQVTRENHYGERMSSFGARAILASR